MTTHFRHGLRAARFTLAGCVAMLLPFLAAADSQLEVGATGASLRATARVKFKITIPAVLSLETPRDDESSAQDVAVFSNNRTVTLAATFASSGQARGTVLLSSAAGKVIAQKVACTPGSNPTTAPPMIGGQRVVPGAAGIVCTACMP